MKGEVVLGAERADIDGDILVLDLSGIGCAPRIQQIIDGAKTLGLTVRRWHPPRTTGPRSQNNAIYGYAAQIAEATGDVMDQVLLGAKHRAIRRGYKWRINSRPRVVMFDNGVPIVKIRDEVEPYSTTEIDTVQAGYLIDELKQIADEFGIRLVEVAE